MTDEIDLEQIESPKGTSQMFSVTLSVFEWHKLLKELEYLQQICNRDQDNVVNLWENIATQLGDKEAVMYGSLKHRKLCPKEFDIHPVIPPKEIEATPKKKVSWWKFWSIT